MAKIIIYNPDGSIASFTDTSASQGSTGSTGADGASGAITASSLTNSGDTNLNGALTVEGASTFASVKAGITTVDELTFIDGSSQTTATLKGDKGDPGPQGIDGIQGIQGPKGDIGATGATGAQGATGATGDKGDTGPAGPAASGDITATSITNSGSGSIGGDLTVTGTTTLNGATNAKAITSTGSTVNGNETVTGTLTVGGKTTLGQTVAGALTANGVSLQPSSILTFGDGTTLATAPSGGGGTNPTLTNMANGYGPAAQLNGASISSTVPGNFNGSTVPNTFTPSAASALMGLNFTNYSATGASVTVTLQNITTNTPTYSTVLGQNSVGNYSFTSTQYPLVANNTYQWQFTRSSSGVAYVQVNPQYLIPAASTSAASYFSSGFAISTSTNIANVSSAAMQQAGIPGQIGYYKNAYASYLYTVDFYLSGTGVVQPYFYNYTTSTNGYNSFGTITLTGSVQKISYGPFSFSTAPLAANSYYGISLYAPTGAITVTYAYASIQVVM